jgi:hypothetical protein
MDLNLYAIGGRREEEGDDDDAATLGIQGRISLACFLHGRSLLSDRLHLAFLYEHTRFPRLISLLGDRKEVFLNMLLVRRSFLADIDCASRSFPNCTYFFSSNEHLPFDKI